VAAGSQHPNPRLEAGRIGESIAAEYLRLIGLQLVGRNLRVGQKEIDLIARDGECLVFVEVRLRRSQRYGGALASVTTAKHGHLRAAIREEVLRRDWRGAYRLDLLTIDLLPAREGMILEHYRGL
jgi:putative endonuclease